MVKNTANHTPEAKPSLPAAGITEAVPGAKRTESTSFGINIHAISGKRFPPGEMPASSLVSFMMR